MADRQSLHAWATAIRNKVESAGVSFGGMAIPTDAETRAVLTAAYVVALQDGAYTIPNWKLDAGVYVELDAAKIIAIATAVRTHVQACFDKNREVDDLILSGQINTRDQIVSAFGELS